MGPASRLENKCRKDLSRQSGQSLIQVMVGMGLSLIVILGYSVRVSGTMGSLGFSFNSSNAHVVGLLVPPGQYYGVTCRTDDGDGTCVRGPCPVPGFSSWTESYWLW